MLVTVVYLLSYLYFFVLWNNFDVHVPKVIGYVSVNWNIQSNTYIVLLYTYMAICFHWDVLQFSYFFLDLLDLDEEAGMIQKSTNQTDQMRMLRNKLVNENAGACILNCWKFGCRVPERKEVEVQEENHKQR